MNNLSIKPGDIVSVHFNNSEVTLSKSAIVQTVPAGTGDSWVFLDNETGYIHYVSEGCTVSKQLNPRA